MAVKPVKRRGAEDAGEAPAAKKAKKRKAADAGDKLGGSPVALEKARKKKPAKQVSSGGDDDDDDNGGKKAKKELSDRQKRKKEKKTEVTSLYGELINPGRERKADTIVGEILEVFEARTATLPECCAGEVGSKVMQACLKWGSIEQRRTLLTGLKDHLPKMAVTRSGHVVVLKLLRYATRTASTRTPTAAEKKAREQNFRTFLEGFRGKSLRVAFHHKQGCKVVNAIYFSEAIGSKERRRLLHEIALPQALVLRLPHLQSNDKSLRELLRAKETTEEHRAKMLSHLREVIEKCAEKELLAIDIVHLLFQAYCGDASEAQLRDLADKCIAGAPHLLSSKPGAEATLRLLGVVNAKERKAFCRDLKGKFSALAQNAVDYVVTMRLASTVDDTVLLGKTMLSEWSEDLEAIAFDKYGHKALAWIFRPGDRRFFSPYEIDCLALPAPGSLKQPEQRRQELSRSLKPPLRTLLLSQGTALRMAADVHAKDLLFAYLQADWDAEVLEALVAGGVAEAKEHGEDFGALGSGTATTTLLALLKLEPEGASDLAAPLWHRVLEPHLLAAAGGASRCAFVLLGLLKHSKLGSTVLAAIKKQRKAILAAVSAAEASGKAVNGARKLLEAVEKGT